jgi:NAD-dependent DNA ligase
MLDLGVGAAMVKKIVAEFDRVFGSTVSMRQLMVASQCFGVGIGDRRLQQLEDAGVAMRWLSQADEDEIVAKVSKIAGWSDKTVTLLISGLPKWQKFHDSVAKMITIYGSLPKRKKPSVNEGPLKGQRISFTGYRDKQQEAAIETAGGEVVPFGSKTKILLVKAGGKASSKVDKAKEKGIKVCSFEDLKL